MSELDCEESWAQKNWCFWTVVLEKTLESPLDCKEIQPVHPKGDQSWMFNGRTDAEAETPILWPPHVKSWLIGKDPDYGRDWGQEEKGMTEDEMAGWHHQLNGHEWVNSESLWWTVRPCVLWFMGSQRVGHNWVTELNWYIFSIFSCKEYNQSEFCIDYLVMSMCGVFSCVAGRGCLLWPVHSPGKTLLNFALLHSVLQGHIFLLLQVFLDFLLFFSPL